MRRNTFLNFTGYLGFLLILSIFAGPRDLQSAWLSQTECGCENCVQAQTRGTPCDCGTCEKQCPHCDGYQCVLETREIAVEKSSYQAKQEIVCLPKVRFPWQQDRPPICSKSRTVNRLEKRTFECRQCSYVWKVTEPVCESACTSLEQQNNPPAAEGPQGVKTAPKTTPFKLVDPLPMPPKATDIPRPQDNIYNEATANATVAPIQRYEHSQTRLPTQSHHARQLAVPPPAPRLAVPPPAPRLAVPPPAPQLAVPPPAPYYPAMPIPQGVMTSFTDARPLGNSFDVRTVNVPSDQARPEPFPLSSAPLPRRLPSPKQVFQKLFETDSSSRPPQKH